MFSSVTGSLTLTQGSSMRYIINSHSVKIHYFTAVFRHVIYSVSSIRLKYKRSHLGHSSFHATQLDTVADTLQLYDGS